METAAKVKKRREPPPEPLPPPPEWPPWLTRKEMERLPPRAQKEVEDTIVPAYRELVRDKIDPVEKAAGEKFVYLGWLELLRVARMTGEHACRWYEASSAVSVEHEIDRYLRLGGERLRTGGFLLRLKRDLERSSGFMKPLAGEKVAREAVGNGTPSHQFSSAARGNPARQTDAIAGRVNRPVLDPYLPFIWPASEPALAETAPAASTTENETSAVALPPFAESAKDVITPVSASQPAE